MHVIQNLNEKAILHFLHFYMVKNKLKAFKFFKAHQQSLDCL